jgi:DNA-binding NtrC family response regulator
LKTATQEDSVDAGALPDADAQPGLLVVHAMGRPRHLVLPLADGVIALGRDELAAAGIPDGRVSRRHLHVTLDGDRWSVRDLGSRNGTFVDGRQAQGARDLAVPVVRIGHTLILPVRDTGPHVSPGVSFREGIVMGPALAAVHERIALIARSGASLLVHGGSGAGKELATEAFHAATGRKPLVAVNCATIQKELAERVLFGARRGAYTGAVADTTGLVQAADGGTLFLDEIAELDLGVQAKLLRFLETRRVTPLGAVDAVRVDVRLCAATHKDLRREVMEGRFRADLFFRLARPSVTVPPLCERRDEIPWLVDRALVHEPIEGAAAAATASVELVEACMLRAWPGNVRELLAEVQIAALAARAADRTTVGASDLDPDAGRAIETSSRGGPDEPRASSPAKAPGSAPPWLPAAASSPPEDASAPGAPGPSPSAIEAALRAERGNVARAAARLGVARIRVRRFVEREGIDLRALRS